MNRKTLTLIVCCAAMITVPARAAWVQGLGAATCKTFIANVQSGLLTQDNYFDWAQGYLSHMNVEQEKYGRVPLSTLNPSYFNISAQKGYVWNYCNNNTLAHYSDAVIGVWNVLVARSKPIS